MSASTPPSAEPAENELAEASRDAALRSFLEIPGLGPSKAVALWEAGYTSRVMLRDSSVEELCGVPGFARGLATLVLRELKDLPAESAGPGDVGAASTGSGVVVIDAQSKEATPSELADLDLSSDTILALAVVGIKDRVALMQAKRAELLRAGMDHERIDRLFVRLGRRDTLPPAGPGLVEGISQKAKSILSGIFGSRPAAPSRTPSAPVSTSGNGETRVTIEESAPAVAAAEQQKGGDLPAPSDPSKGPGSASGDASVKEVASTSVAPTPEKSPVPEKGPPVGSRKQDPKMDDLFDEILSDIEKKP